MIVLNVPDVGVVKFAPVNERYIGVLTLVRITPPETAVVPEVTTYAKPG
jgi:hypothetical protein